MCVVREKTTNSEFAVFEQVRLAFAGGSSFQQEPKELVKAGEKVIGVLKDPVVRTLYSLSEGFLERLGKDMDKHATMHEKRTSKPHSPADCMALSRYHAKMEKGLDIFSKLFWEGTAISFPSDGEGWGIRRGWHVVSLRTGAEVSVYDEKSASFFTDLSRAMLTKDEKGLSFDGIKFETLDMEAEEHEIVTLVTPSLKALFLLLYNLSSRLNEIRNDMKTTLPNGKSAEQMLNETHQKVTRLKGQAEVVRSLFWLGVRELYPKVDRHDHVALRKHWVVVHVPAEENPLRALAGGDGGLTNWYHGNEHSTILRCAWPPTGHASHDSVLAD